MIALFFVSGALILAINLYAFVLACVLFFAGTYAFRQMAKADPFMFSVWFRQLSYKEYYAAYSRPYRTADKSLNSKGY